MLHFSFSRVIVGCALLTIAAPAMPASADWARLTIPDVGDQVVANSRGAVFALVSQQVKILEANGQWATIQGNGDSTWAVRAIAAGGNRLLAHHATKDQIWEWNGISWSLISDGPRVAAMAVDGAGTAYVMLTGVVFMKQLAGATDWTISNIGQQMVRLLAGGNKVFGTGTDGILTNKAPMGFPFFSTRIGNPPSPTTACCTSPIPFRFGVSTVRPGPINSWHLKRSSAEIDCWRSKVVDCGC